MCIIVVKDKHNSLPKEEYLKNCFDNNPDGAGFMYVKNNKVVIDKGYMTYTSFLKRYKKLCRKFNDFKDKSLVMHFRIGTAGANSRENTHPYPVTYDKKLLHSTYIKTDLGVVHNGIIHDYNPEVDDTTTNDTQNFITNYIYPLYSHYKDFYKNKYIMSGIEEITNSKFAFLDKYDNIYLVGEYETDEEGIKYSNTNYLPYSNYIRDYYNYYNYLDGYYYNEHSYDDEDYKYIPAKKEEYDEIFLEPNWYYSVNDQNFEKVGDKNLVYDYYYNLLYEVNDMGDYEYVSDNVLVFDENGEELIF